MRQTPRIIALLVALVLTLGTAGAAVASETTSAPEASRPAATSDVSLARILGGYTRPVLVTHAPDGGRVIFIVEQTGTIKRAVFRDGRWKKLGTFLDIRSLVNDPRTDGGERGLLGLAFHPDYQRNGRFYVYYTRAAAGGRNGDAVVAEYRRKSPSQARRGSRRVLLVIDQPAANHNGGHLAFGPDGRLYIGTGDGGGAGDPWGNGQDKGTRLGKLLRIDPLDPDGKGPRRYRTPGSNPRVGKNGLNDLWAWGLRNPWRFSFDRKTGDLWIGDVGQGAREEVDLAPARAGGTGAGKGHNYGWDRCEGSRRHPNTDADCTFGMLPVMDYPHGEGRCSVTGGYVHRGPRTPDWRGLYVAGDFCGRLFVLDGSGDVRFSKVTNRSISSFGEDARGRIYATDVLRGKIYMVGFRGPRP